MATATVTATAPAPVIDMTFINELYEEIEARPPALEARKLLIQQCLEAGWMEAALDATKDFLVLSPFDAEAQAWLATLSGEEQKKAPEPATAPATATAPIVMNLRQPEPVDLPDDLDLAQIELVQGYENLRTKAKKLLRETALLQDLTRHNGDSNTQDKRNSILNVLGQLFSVAKKKDPPLSSRFETHVQDLTALADGRVSSVVRVRQPGSAQSVAREMESNPGKAMDIAIGDLEDMARWLRSPSCQTTPLDNDAVRDALVKRVQTLSAALPEEIKIHASQALMHVEHEALRRTYVCEETMYGDPVSDIPRANFLVTEDGYPWDMEELAQAIASNGGVMRNPLSKQMFTTKDIRAIVQHPLGKRLAALQIEQSKLSQGVRPQTIDELDKMSAVLLADMSSDQMESRHVVDAFMAYVATLPEPEQKALDGLKVPAKDSHTGQAFDTTIGEAVRDAQGNRVCFHKTGDFLKQAAAHLRTKKK